MPHPPKKKRRKKPQKVHIPPLPGELGCKICSLFVLAIIAKMVKQFGSHGVNFNQISFLGDPIYHISTKCEFVYNEENFTNNWKLVNTK